MPAPANTFKKRLEARETQVGLWVSSGDASIAELAAGCGYDWLVIDGEHGPNGLRDILGQLRAVGDKSHPVVRVPDDNRATIKQMLDIGAQTILVPMIDSAEQAREAVRSMLYPPKGVRGVGAAVARASGYSAIGDYTQTANETVCLLVQVESLKGLEALDDILAVEGVDGVFIGPSDLGTDMGYGPDAPEVREAVTGALKRIQEGGKAAGVLATVPDVAKDYVDMGVEFVAVGGDVLVLRAALCDLRAKF
ncbi:HpcH/HpaI aldolase family protein [Salipiger mucosus]|uniref:Hydroxypyruvate/pyruvate aldolase n=1 Tax=Salipiger mucosus DSM 16094 TaxID=1123237 RepID=S9S8K4_9RHOB|nr:HpcH/HpaI aldolase/citrate lyase family protein [Salipiger mucosus]EPX82569.1 2,4-dihydroxyhept-2-ene-1,7-dioic acid aldolase [Salipiger mucosus DSM 16094]